MFKMKFIFTSLTLTIYSVLGLAQNLPSPGEFLSTEYSQEFSYHHEVVGYFHSIAEKSENVIVKRYGETYQKRPLIMAVVSSEDNLKRIEDIRKNNLIAAGLMEGTYDPSLAKGIVWLGYTVHGNESAGTECSMQLLHDLATHRHPDTERWLQDMIIIIEPCQNPDGFARYTDWMRNVQQLHTNPDPEDLEHREEWASGRLNHYLFDLNRDWLWLTQQESKHRIAEYNKWMPHIHVDVHEMGYNENYFFAPAARPYHKLVTPWQKELQRMIGKNNASHFDQHGWLYFSGEVFDLFYPSYGDTYPTFNGAIGMTYEQAGIGAGRAVRTNAHTTLTIEDRIAHHRTSSLSTLEVAHHNQTKLIDNFRSYFDYSKDHKVRTYILRQPQNTKSQLDQLATWLDQHQIYYGAPDNQASTEGWNYQKGVQERFEIQKGDMIISSAQPKSKLVRAIFDYEHFLEDSLSYDITAWTYSMASGLDAYHVDKNIESSPWRTPQAPKESSPSGAVPIAWVIPWSTDLMAAQTMTSLLEEGLTLRITGEELTIKEEKIKAGSAFLNKADNPDMDWPALCQKLSEKTGHILPLTTGWSEAGPNLGSETMIPLRKKKIATLEGRGINPIAHGQIRFMFEQHLRYPIVRLSLTHYLDKLSNYDVLILPDGKYTLDTEHIQQLHAWVKTGGRLIVMAGTNRLFAESDLFALKYQSTEESENPKDYPILAYGAQSRTDISALVTGAIIKNKVDTSHPFARGYREAYFSLKSSNKSYALLSDGWNVIYTPDKDPHIIGFVGAEIGKKIPNSLTLGVEEIGRGEVVYMIDDPLFRMFWEAGKMYFANSVFMPH